MITLHNPDRPWFRLEVGLRYAIWLLITGCALGCTPTPTGPVVSDRMASTPEEQPSERPAPPSRAVAVVNAQPIDARQFTEILIESRGLSLLQQIIGREVARQELNRLGLSVSRDDIETEYDITIEANRFNGKDHGAMTPARRNEIIETWAQTRGVSLLELAIAMERQACLRKIAETQVMLTEDQVQREFRHRYAEKAEVRHIQIPSKRSWPEIKLRLDRGDRFEDLVADFSQNPVSREHRGLLPPFTSDVDNDTVPPIFAKVAFNLSIGQVSNPIEAEGSFHILKLERRIPAENVAFDAIRDDLREKVRARLIAEAIEQLGRDLFMAAQININDPVLRRQYVERLDDGRMIGPPLRTTLLRLDARP